MVDFKFPDSEEISSFKARVVQRIPPQTVGQSLRAGMAVVFDQPDAVLARLKPFLATAVTSDASAS
ncbi:hypothetical protein D3C83_200940 [compost metagenome]